MDTRAAGKSDRLADSVSYGDVCSMIRDEMTRQNDKLLERACERLARAILLAWPVFRELEITVKKPWAPVLMHLDYAAVTIRRGWHRVYVGAGSNMGDRQAYLDMAKKALMEDEEIRDFQSARIIETEPYGYVDQDKFLNTVYTFDTLYTPEELLTLLQSIENQAGRTREIHWGPRTLDLDLLLYDHLVTEDPRLVLPHPEVHKRLFVLESLCELYPYGLHPVTNERFCDIKKRLEKE